MEKENELTEEQKDTIEIINNMSHYNMCDLWRNAPSGHPFLDKTQPFFEVFEKRLFEHFGGFTSPISKAIGWDSKEKKEEYKNKNDKLFSFVLREANGEREYTHDCLVWAAGYDQAHKKAFDKEIHYFDNGEVALTIENLTGTTKENWLEQTYMMALI
jgi:hypothetical protein